MSSTDQIYQIAASRLGDKCDRSMTHGKLLDNNALFMYLLTVIINEYMSVRLVLKGEWFVINVV